jgi:ATP phosphoribosyltransferase regulatory subunit
VAERHALGRQLPHGVKDLFLAEAAKLSQLEERLRRLFARWGYVEIRPPTFEYHDNLAVGAGPRLQREMYRFLDHAGQTLALRPDFTVPTARIVGTKLYDQPLPMRFGYVGSVFRYAEPQAGRQREFSQAGVELIGAATPEADAEAIALAVEALRILGLDDFQVNLGQMAFFRAIVARLELSVDDAARLEAAIDRKNTARLRELLEELGVSGATQQPLLVIPGLCGGPEVIELARRLDQGPVAAAALDHLAQVYHLLTAYGVADRVTLDLGQVRGMEYYTGITFEGFTAGMGFPVVGGGRYDNLIGQFGPSLPAVGFALTIERALIALERARPMDVSLAPDVLVATCGRAGCLRWVGHMRTAGMRVEVDVLGRDPATLLDYARQRGIRRVLACDEDGHLRPLLGDSPIQGLMEAES